MFFDINTLIIWGAWFPLDVLKEAEKALSSPHVCPKSPRRDTVGFRQSQSIALDVWVSFHICYYIIDGFPRGRPAVVVCLKGGIQSHAVHSLS